MCGRVCACVCVCVCGCVCVCVCAQGPQKATSAYMLFTMAKRAEVVEEFPGIQGKEVMKLLGAKWKELSAEDKAVR